VQQHVAALQAELKAAQAAADLEATLGEFHAFIRNGVLLCGMQRAGRARATCAVTWGAACSPGMHPL
jgi:dienelactone hydrolase